MIRIRIPRNFPDILPPAPPYIPPTEPEDEDDSESTTALIGFRTACDSYGISREYPCGKPSITPNSHNSIYEVSDSPYLSSLTTNPTNNFEPFRNASTFRLMDWFYRPSITKSIAEVNALVKDVILAPDFNPEDLIGFDAAKENSRMDKYRTRSSDGPTPFSYNNGWLKGSVDIQLPCDGFRFSSEAEAPSFKVEFHYRKLTEVIRSALAEPRTENFHTFPFKTYWQPSPDDPEERVYSEIYTGDFWNAEYEKLQGIPHSGHLSDLEIFIIGLLIWSDSTSLAQFGNAELWPIYLYIGNQSKYERAKPNSLSSHHLAYLPKVVSSRNIPLVTDDYDAA